MAPQVPVVGVISSEEFSCLNKTLVKNELIPVSSDGESDDSPQISGPNRSISEVKTRSKYIETKDEIYKKKLFLLTKKIKEKELHHMQELHAAKITSIEMERELKLRCMQEEHNAKIQMLNRSKYFM